MSGHGGPPPVVVAAMDQWAACAREAVESAVADLIEHDAVCDTPWCGMAGIITQLADDQELSKVHVAEIAAMALHMLAAAMRTMGVKP